MHKLNDKVIWITGASSGIGEALAKQLNTTNKVLLSARRVSELERVKAACPNPEHVKLLSLDLLEADSLTDQVQEAIGLFGRIDVLINNAGISQRSLIAETDLEVDRKVMEVNYFGTIAITKALLPHFQQHKSGHVVVLSSAVGIITTKLRSAYAASKHALHGFFETLRTEHFEDNLKVTLVLPSFIKTAIAKSALTGDGSEQAKSEEKIDQGMDADECARQIIRAMERAKEEVYISGFREKLAIYIKRFYPALFSRIIRKAKVT